MILVIKHGFCSTGNVDDIDQVYAIPCDSFGEAKRWILDDVKDEKHYSGLMYDDEDDEDTESLKFTEHCPGDDMPISEFWYVLEFPVSWNGDYTYFKTWDIIEI